MIEICNTHKICNECVTSPYYIGVGWDWCYEIMLNGQPIGNIFLSEGDDFIFIEWVELGAEFRGRGYIRQVIDCLIAEFNVPFIMADTSDELLKMYEHLGFYPVERDDFREMTTVKMSTHKEE